LSAISTRETVNLLARLDDERFAPRPIHHAIERWDREGIRVERFHAPPDAVLAWIDAEFGGSWSSEAFAGGMWLAHDRKGPLGFATFDPRGLRFAWLREWRDRPEAGIFGPFGVAPAARGRGLGALLLHAALGSLRERGYRDALIPVVGGERLIGYYEREAGARVAQRVDLAALAGRRRATVLASGDGSNFEAVVEAARSGALPLDVGALVCNRPSAGAVARAQRLGVAASVVAWDRATTERAAYDALVQSAVAATEPELVLLLGWMHILPAAFVERFPGSLNLHPAFLPLDPARDTVTMPDGTTIPALRGARAVDEAFAAGIHWGGATVHRLGVSVDRGEIFARAPLLRTDAETRDSYATRLHALERTVVAAAIRRWSFERTT
jgi:phosphoribosylglycinamide formyltransferase-1